MKNITLRSGLLSSEFFLHILAVVGPIVGAALASSANPLVAVLAGIVMSVTSQYGAVQYAANRTSLKQAALDAATEAAKALVPVAVQAATAAVAPPAP